MRNTAIATAAALLSLTLAPLAASAQEVPSYAGNVAADEQIHGRIVAFDGAYSVTVSDDRGFTDNVELHDGTIINPTGLTLAPGMVVSILGDNAGNVFDANEIDTPYTIDAGVPSYSGHPWNFYGPSIGFAFFFGNTTWWHRDDVRNVAPTPARVGFAQRGGNGDRGGFDRPANTVRPVTTLRPGNVAEPRTFGRGGTTFQANANPRGGNFSSGNANRGNAASANAGNSGASVVRGGGSRSAGHESRR